MIKKIKELDKRGKLLLLEAIASGRVKKDLIDNKSLFAIDSRDAFLLLMIASSGGEGQKGPNCIWLGPASEALAEIINLDRIHR